MLERYIWETLTDEKLTLVEDQIYSAPYVFAYSPETSIVRAAHLPFYENILLIEIYDPEWPHGTGPLWFLGNSENLWLLDGSSAPIHNANEAGPVSVTAENVIDYVYFFCFFIHGDEGPFFLVEDIYHPVFDYEMIPDEDKAQIREAIEPVEYMGTTPSGLLELCATVLYGNALFSTRFMVTLNGLIDMIDDEPLVADIPARKLKPNY